MNSSAHGDGGDFRKAVYTNVFGVETSVTLCTAGSDFSQQRLKFDSGGPSERLQRIATEPVSTAFGRFCFGRRCEQTGVMYSPLHDVGANGYR